MRRKLLSNVITRTFILFMILVTVLCDERYLLYQVSPTEGFNLRRDVYMRLARTAKQMNWTLVLPPWGPLPHWKASSGLQWSLFFDVDSLNEYTKVIEFNDFMDRFVGDVLLDNVYVLRHAPIREDLDDTFTVVECGPHVAYRLVNGLYEGDFFGKDDIKARNVTCLEISATGSVLAPLFEKNSIIMLDHAEVVLHDGFGDKEYWRVRKSMRFAKELQDEADKFIKKHLNDKYLAVHLRRSDFPIVRPNDVPSIKGAAAQVKQLLKERGLKKVFLATDGDEKEVNEFLRQISEAVVYHRTGIRFENSESLIENSSGNLCENLYPASGVAIPDRETTSQCSGNRGDLDKPCTSDEGRCRTVQTDESVKALPMEEKPLPSGGSCRNDHQHRDLSTNEGKFQPSCGESAGPVDKPCLFKDSCSSADRDGDDAQESIGVHENVLKTSHEKCENPHQDKGVRAARSAVFEPKCDDCRSVDQPCGGMERCSAVPGHSSEPQLTGKSQIKAVEKGTSTVNGHCAGSDGTEVDISCHSETCSSKEDAKANDYIEGACIGPRPSHLTEGQIAIVDQIICSRAEVFVGSFESTFSFRIQEEREILGKAPDTTFNRLCADGEMSCQQPTRWTILN